MDVGGLEHVGGEAPGGGEGREYSTVAARVRRSIRTLRGMGLEGKERLVGLAVEVRVWLMMRVTCNGRGGAEVGWG